MGAWGNAAWENDGAADWFGETLRATGLAKIVEETLAGNPEDDFDERIRAAAYVLVTLGRLYIWPVEDLDRHLSLAIEKLGAIREMDVYQDSPEMLEAIGKEIEELRSRQKSLGTD